MSDGLKQPLRVRSVPIRYSDEGAGAPHVFVHGAGANRSYWRQLAARLTGVRAIAPDLFGHGEMPAWAPGTTGPGDYRYGHDVELLEQLATTIDGPLALVGHSSGASVCLEYARLHPERVARLVLAEPMLPTMLAAPFPEAYAEVAGAYTRAHEAARQGRFEDAARELFEYILGDGQWARLTDGTRAWMTRNAQCTLVAHSEASLALPSSPDRYAQVACPVLLLHGEHTREPYRRICELLAASLPDVRSLTVAGASHNALLTHLDAIEPAVRSFLAE